MQKDTKTSDQLRHDIKSTIMSITSYSQLLQRKLKDDLDETSKHYFDRLDKQIASLVSLVDKLS